jgi:hypothetical protein
MSTQDTPSITDSVRAAFAVSRTAAPNRARTRARHRASRLRLLERFCARPRSAGSGAGRRARLGALSAKTLLDFRASDNDKWQIVHGWLRDWVKD